MENPIKFFYYNKTLFLEKSTSSYCYSVLFNGVHYDLIENEGFWDYAYMHLNEEFNNQEN